jgi:rfaE bifunctional protein kinase chain/domain
MRIKTNLVEHLSKERLGMVLDSLADRKIGVVGDLGLDAYWYADMTRSFLSRETPRFARPVVREEYSPGAGANVADNLQALGVGQVVVLSVLGDDWREGILRREMETRGIVVEQLIVSPQRSTTTFIKPVLMGYDSQQEDARVDFENAEPLPPELEEALIDRISSSLPGLDVILVADQLDVNGVVTDRVREALNRLATDQPDKLFVADSRQRIGLFRNMVLKPNWVEATVAIRSDQDPRALSRRELATISKRLSQLSNRPTFVTLSEGGVLVCAEGSCRQVPIPPVRPPLDPVGAGDAFIAALAAALAAGATPWEAGAMANLAAAVTVEKLNETGTASPDEILERYALAETEGAK